MKPKSALKPLKEQVISITGASSGIGLATARLAAKKGAKVFLISRSEKALRQICDEIRSRGGEAELFVCDVADEQELQSAARRCVERFGRIDTWINNAGVSVYGKFLETPTSEARRLFETNYWGVFHGCRAAIPYLRTQGGALINIGSVLSKVGLPIQAVYSSSKFAVKGLTDAIRRELESEQAPISVSLVMPGAIDTLYANHAESHLNGNPTHTPPVYAPEVVARTILACARRPVREIGVGSSAFLYPLLDRLFPKSQDFLMSRMMNEAAQTRKKPGGKGRQPGLKSAPAHEGEIRGDYPGHVMRSSLTTALWLRPWARRFLALGLFWGGLGVWQRSRHARIGARPLSRAA